MKDLENWGIDPNFWDCPLIIHFKCPGGSLMYNDGEVRTFLWHNECNACGARIPEVIHDVALLAS